MRALRLPGAWLNAAGLLLRLVRTDRHQHIVNEIFASHCLLARFCEHLLRNVRLNHIPRVLLTDHHVVAIVAAVAHVLLAHATTRALLVRSHRGGHLLIGHAIHAVCTARTHTPPAVENFRWLRGVTGSGISKGGPVSLI